MPNRIIKESICTSDTIDLLSWFEEVFFYRLIVNSDDYGRLDARPAILKARLFPLKNVTEKQICDALNKLSTVGIVTVYEYDGRPYLQLVTWDKHQQIRAKKSKYPTPDESCNQMISDDIKCPRNPIQSESNPNQNPNIYAQRFEEFWQAYPRKRSKGQAERTWYKIKPDEQLHDRIMQSLEQAKTSVDWKKNKGQYIPYPSTWLNSKGWEDEFDPPKKQYRDEWGID